MNTVDCLTSHSQAGFSTPIGVCLPFGVMDLALAASPGLSGGSSAAAEASALLQKLDSQEGLSGENVAWALGVRSCVLRDWALEVRSCVLREGLWGLCRRRLNRAKGDV